MLALNTVFSQNKIQSSASLFKILEGKDTLVDSVLSNFDKYRFQLELTEVFANDFVYSISLGTPSYFYPASLVKLPVAMLTMEKLERLGLDLNCSIEVGEYNSCKNETFIQLCQKNTLSFKQILEELLIVSDNHHYNTLFHFLTPKEINESLRKKGFNETFIYRSFEGCDIENQLLCAQIIVKDSSGKIVYNQHPSSLDTSYMQNYFPYSKERLIGKKRYEKRKILNEPVDFNFTNDISLKDIHKILKTIVLNDAKSSNHTWNVNSKNLDFIKQCLQKFPREMNISYHKDFQEIPDNEFKYILIGESTDSIINNRTFSKIAYSYGFTTETAYMPIDNKHGVFLSMTIYTNENGILNDGKYEYTEIARPVFNRISNLLLEYLTSQ